MKGQRLVGRVGCPRRAGPREQRDRLLVRGDRPSWMASENYRHKRGVREDVGTGGRHDPVEEPRAWWSFRSSKTMASGLRGIPRTHPRTGGPSQGIQVSTSKSPQAFGQRSHDRSVRRAALWV